LIENSGSFGYFAGLDTTGANLYPSGCPGREDDADLLQIGIKPTPGFVISV
jgi:hypothetical protein